MRLILCTHLKFLNEISLPPSFWGGFSKKKKKVCHGILLYNLNISIIKENTLTLITHSKLKIL